MTESPDLAFHRLRTAFSLEAVPAVAARIDRLQALGKAIDSQRDQIADAVSADFGYRSRTETMTAEVGFTLQGIRHLVKRLPRWSRPRTAVILQPMPGRTAIWREPKGVVGVLSPWNYPVQLALMPLATAIATGNRVLLKPSERTPATSDLLAQIIAQVFPAHEATVVLGDAKVAAAVSALPFDHLFFTGSTQTGRKVALAAAENLTPVTLELGGKSPCIMLPGAVPALHAPLAGWGKWFSAGQTCVAPDYMLVPRGSAQVWGQAMLDVARGFVGTNGQDYSALIDADHREKLEAMVRDAGSVLQLERDLPGRMAPTVVLNPPRDSAVMRDEIFGPILPILEYDSLDDVVAMVNGMAPPLALYAFDTDATAARALTKRIRSGGAAINATILHLAAHDLPFGGIGTSGMGAYHGDRGLAEFTHERSVLTVAQGAWTTALVPPYSPMMRKLIGWMNR